MIDMVRSLGLVVLVYLIVRVTLEVYVHTRRRIRFWSVRREQKRFDAMVEEGRRGLSAGRSGLSQRS